MKIETLDSGTATIADDASFNDGPWIVHGVAQASEVTRGVSGERRYWPPETLRDAVDKLIGTPVVSPEEHQDLTPGQANPETIIGEVVDAAYDEEQEELVYQAEIDEKKYAKLAARGRIDVSPSLALRDGERDPDRDAIRVEEVLEYRDLAAVTEGAHASASIHLGTAEALADHFGIDVDALQEPAEANDTGVDVSPPDAVQNAAQAALDAKEEYAGDIGDCGTGVGETRAEQIVADDLEPADFVTRNEGRTPVPAYLASHEEDAPDTDQPPTDWDEETWTDGCGPVQYALWGGTGTGTGIEWAQRTANEVMRALDEEPVYEGLQRDRARTPTYDGTQDESWSTPDLDDYLTAYDSLPTPNEANSVDDLTRDQRSLIARKSLLGTAAGETLREVRFFPVVDPETDELNRRALGAVRSGRGAQADIPDDARASAQRVAGELLVEEFGSDIDPEALTETDTEAGTSDDGADATQLQSTPANNTVFNQTMSDLTDAEQELLAAARQLDDPTVVEAGVSERLSELDETISVIESKNGCDAGLINAIANDAAERLSEGDEAHVVPKRDYETLQERVDTIEGVIADALQDRTGLSDAAIEAMPFEAMAAEFETDDGDLDVDALSQNPETGSGGADESGDTEVDTERLSEIKTKLDHAEAALPDSRVEALREEAADLADVDDYDAAIEVL